MARFTSVIAVLFLGLFQAQSVIAEVEASWGTVKAQMTDQPAPAAKPADDILAPVNSYFAIEVDQSLGDVSLPAGKDSVVVARFFYTGLSGDTWFINMPFHIPSGLAGIKNLSAYWGMVADENRIMTSHGFAPTVPNASGSITVSGDTAIVRQGRTVALTFIADVADVLPHEDFVLDLQSGIGTVVVWAEFGRVYDSPSVPGVRREFSPTRPSRCGLTISANAVAGEREELIFRGKTEPSFFRGTQVKTFEIYRPFAGDVVIGMELDLPAGRYRAFTFKYVSADGQVVKARSLPLPRALDVYGQLYVMFEWLDAGAEVEADLTSIGVNDPGYLVVYGIR